ncbi:MAG: hypothetical protein O7C98_01060 [Planctomycetota bacterium]|nr:hypothetical protein [Planctomycetota bacterium]
MLLTTLVLAACATSRGGTPDPGREPEPSILEPFVEKRTRAGAQIGMVRPFYWREFTTEASGPRQRVHVLGRLYRRHWTPSLTTITVPFISYTARRKPERYRSWYLIVFPFLWWGNDRLLIFPFGGKTTRLLGYDQLVMITPFYITARLGSWRSVNIFWPLISWGTDGKPGGRRRRRFAPFWGKSRLRDGTETGFFLWPFYTWRRNGPDRGFFFWPFYGRTETGTFVQKTWLWPFFYSSENYLTGARDRGFWPVWRSAGGGDGLEIRRLWPVRSYRRTGFTTTDVTLWPFFRRMYVDDGDTFQRIQWVLPLYTNVHSYNRRDGAVTRKTNFFPFYFKETRSDGFRWFEFPHVIPVDSPTWRNYYEPWRPFLTLYSHRRHPDGSRDTSAALGLLQWNRTKEYRSFTVPLVYHKTRWVSGRRKTRLLLGSIGWDRNEKGRFLRLLWFIKIRTGDPQ